MPWSMDTHHSGRRSGRCSGGLLDLPDAARTGGTSQEVDYGPHTRPRRRHADAHADEVRLFLRRRGLRRADHGGLRPRGHSQAGQGRAVANQDRLPLLHASSLRPRRRLPVLPADALGPEHRQGEPSAGIRSQPHREVHRGDHGGKRSFRPRLESQGEPSGQPAGVRQPRRGAATEASRHTGEGHRPGQDLFRGGLGDDRGQGRARPAVPRLARPTGSTARREASYSPATRSRASR